MRRLFMFFARLWSVTWFRRIILTLLMILTCVAIWFGLLWTRIDFLTSVWFRGGLIALFVGIIGLVAFIKYRRRKAAADALQETLVEVPVGDGEVLSERMEEALAKLKKTGGKTYLYDLPWYVIIGPPGAGKTTALMHSGLEFPGTDKNAVAGFGGTKNCDFWFSEDAILIDTAGRYTTQDSDQQADELSWGAFLENLKSARSNQPINGVILSFSCEDLLTVNDEDLDKHALTIRQRLLEIHEKLRIDIPVYVMFTKADIISGFREYFGTFGEERRRSVWGVTFQTKNRKEETYKSVTQEYDAFISRLSDEVTDRLNEEPDSVARIAIFGFPGQMALMQKNVSNFLKRVFQKASDTNAILRGFYFTSGSQEGTPIDQVLGAMSTGEGFQNSFMSGSGKSFFLHDLLKKVIFVERDWVGYDLKAMRRKAILRNSATVGTVALTLGIMTLFGYSFWQNSTLIQQYQADVDRFVGFHDSQPNLSELTIRDAAPDSENLQEVLKRARDLSTGWARPADQTFFERAGLSHRDNLRRTALAAYSNTLERQLRPRMMLLLERELQELLAKGDTEDAYRSLKVYFLLSKHPSAKPDDASIEAYFREAWLPFYSDVGQQDEYDEMREHLSAMLELDDRVVPTIQPNDTLVKRVQEELASLPLAQRAYSNIVSDASSMTPYVLLDEMDGLRVEEVLRTSDGQPLTSLTIPGLFTSSGYWSVFLEAMEVAEEKLEQDAWLLGDAAGKADYTGQLAGLQRELHLRYKEDFVSAWKELLSRIELVGLSGGAPRYSALTMAASPEASPILKLAIAVRNETRLSRFLDKSEKIELTPESIASGNIGNELAELGFTEAERKSGFLQRFFLRQARERVKFQGRAGASSNAGSSIRRQLDDIEREFEKWHRFAGSEDATQTRPADVLLAGLRKLSRNRQGAAQNPDPAIDRRGMQEAFNELTQNIAFYPETVIRFINQLEGEFSEASTNSTIEQIRNALNEKITGYCVRNVEIAYPFTNTSRHLSTALFGEFFGNGGLMETFYNDYLRDHTQRDANGNLIARNDGAIGSKISKDTLAQFSRAERIRRAFFPPGGNLPSVSFSIRQLARSSNDAGVNLSFGERSVELRPNSSAISITWPQDIGDIVISEVPKKKGLFGNSLVQNNPASRRFEGGRWSILNFLKAGGGRSDGSRLDIAHSLGGRSVAFRLEFDSVNVPFLMRELRQFRCPRSLG